MFGLWRFGIWILLLNGGPDGVRTHDLMTASHALSQTELQAHAARAQSILLDVGEFCKKCAAFLKLFKSGVMNQIVNEAPALLSFNGALTPARGYWNRISWLTQGVCHDLSEAEACLALIRRHV